MSNSELTSSHLYTLDQHTPELHETSWIAPSAVVIGKVKLGAYSSVWFNATIRGDVEYIHIGDRTNIQDGCILHVDDDYPCVVGNNVTVGHNAVLHGCTVEDEVLIGIGAIVLNGAIIRKHAIVGAGAVVSPGTEVASGTVVMGAPAKVRRPINEQELARLAYSAEHYVNNAQRFKRGLR